MWDDAARVALLELVTSGRLKRRKRTAKLEQHLLEQGWVWQSRRADSLWLAERRRADVALMLGNVWPEAPGVHAELAAAGLPVTVEGLRALDDRRRIAAVDGAALPTRLNVRTATSLVAEHTKAALSDEQRSVFDATELTRDGVVRMRPHRGFRLRRGDLVLGGETAEAILGEVVVSERALRDGTALEGAPPSAVLTVENSGAYVDLRKPPDVMILHVPGWNTLLVKEFLATLPGGFAVVHFGDLDPNGVAIRNHLRRAIPTLGWLVPSFWEEYLDPHGLPCEWPDEDLGDVPALVQRLAREGRWLEQERIVLDPRMTAVLASLV
jgi:hypothetical protein